MGHIPSSFSTERKFRYDHQTTATKKATRTITSRDLEPYERARVKSEAAWAKRQKELGLPSLEETRRELARREAALDEFLARKRLEEEVI